MSARRWLPYGAAAVAMHLAMLVALRRAPPPGSRADALVPPTEVDLEVAARDDVAPPPTDLRAPLPAPPPAPQTSHGIGSASALAVLGKETGGPSPEVPGSVEPPAAAPADSGWTFQTGRPSDVLGPGLVARAVQDSVPVVPAPTTVSPTGGLAEGLDARDAALGLGRGGAVASALEAATYADVDAEGKATFDVSIDTSGHISVSLLDASAAAPAWTHVAQAIRASLDAAQVRVPPGAKGWHVVATVESKIQYPNGADPKKMGTKLEADGPALAENKNRASVGDPPIVFKKLPGLTLAHSGKVCSVRIHLGLGPPISGGCDPTNIGAHTTRVVHTHVDREGRL